MKDMMPDQAKMITGGAAAIVPEVGPVAETVSILTVPLITWGELHITGGNICMLLGVIYASWGFFRSWKREKTKDKYC